MLAQGSVVLVRWPGIDSDRKGITSRRQIAGEKHERESRVYDLGQRGCEELAPSTALHRLGGIFDRLRGAGTRPHRDDHDGGDISTFRHGQTSFSSALQGGKPSSRGSVQIVVGYRQDRGRFKGHMGVHASIP